MPVDPRPFNLLTTQGRAGMAQVEKGSRKAFTDMVENLAKSGDENDITVLTRNGKPVK